MSEIRMFLVSPEGEQEFFASPIEGFTKFNWPVRVTGRLRSTRRGASYNWKSRGVPLSGANFEPRVDALFLGHVVVSFLGWHKPSVEYGGEDRVFLSWGGSYVDAPCIISAIEALDLTRRAEREALFASVHERMRGKPLRQGGFEACQLLAYDITVEELENEFNVRAMRPVRPVVLFNHACFVEAAFGLDNERLVLVGDQGAVVTSPDHILSHLRLEPGWWLLGHPFPQRMGVD